jgi:hypothetical protein
VRLPNDTYALDYLCYSISALAPWICRSRSRKFYSYPAGYRRHCAGYPADPGASTVGADSASARRFVLVLVVESGYALQGRDRVPAIRVRWAAGFLRPGKEKISSDLARFLRRAGTRALPDTPLSTPLAPTS